jgi:hypothetical protein
LQEKKENFTKISFLYLKNGGMALLRDKSSNVFKLVMLLMTTQNNIPESKRYNFVQIN